MLCTLRSRSSRYLLPGSLSHGKPSRTLCLRLFPHIDGTIYRHCKGIEPAGSRPTYASAGMRGKSSTERPRTMPAVPGIVNENRTVGKRTPTAGAVSEFGCAGHDDQCGAGCRRQPWLLLGAGPTPDPEVGSPISRCAIAPAERFLEGGIRTAPTP